MTQESMFSEEELADLAGCTTEEERDCVKRRITRDQDQALKDEVREYLDGGKPKRVRYHNTRLSSTEESLDHISNIRDVINHITKKEQS